MIGLCVIVSVSRDHEAVLLQGPHRGFPGQSRHFFAVDGDQEAARVIGMGHDEGVNRTEVGWPSHGFRAGGNYVQRPSPAEA
ncbi:hypothetical protein BG452_06020 [Streptomyces sp. CBMA123]|nr:hypothetical protein [Streptomyces sp. CBMA123]